MLEFLLCLLIVDTESRDQRRDINIFQVVGSKYDAPEHLVRSMWRAGEKNHGESYRDLLQFVSWW